VGSAGFWSGLLTATAAAVPRMSISELSHAAWAFTMVGLADEAINAAIAARVEALLQLAMPHIMARASANAEGAPVSAVPLPADAAALRTPAAGRSVANLVAAFVQSGAVDAHAIAVAALADLAAHSVIEAVQLTVAAPATTSDIPADGAAAAAAAASAAASAAPPTFDTQDLAFLLKYMLMADGLLRRRDEPAERRSGAGAGVGGGAAAPTAGPDYSPSSLTPPLHRLLVATAIHVNTRSDDTLARMSAAARARLLHGLRLSLSWWQLFDASLAAGDRSQAARSGGGGSGGGLGAAAAGEDRAVVRDACHRLAAMAG
jgi:hypothetical protein